MQDAIEPFFSAQEINLKASALVIWNQITRLLDWTACDWTVALAMQPSKTNLLCVQPTGQAKVKGKGCEVSQKLRLTLHVVNSA